MHSDMCPNLSKEIQKEIRAEAGGLRYNEGKLPMHLVPPSMITAMAEVMQAGAEKYEERNWEKGMKWSIVYGCLMRHLMKWWQGADIDETDGINHIKKVLGNAAMLVEYLETHPDLDDRPHKEQP